jgi:hypothetical protein
VIANTPTTMAIIKGPGRGSLDMVGWFTGNAIVNRRSRMD